jgi:hypothetical protein
MPRQRGDACSEVSCNIPGCGRVWPRDPVLEVACPRCAAPPGSPCVARRPSGHVHSAAFAGLPDWGHDERDLAALAAGAYGVCPLGRCGRPQAEGGQLALGLEALAA